MKYRGDVARPRIRFDDVPAEILPSMLGVGGGYDEVGASSEEIHFDDFDLVVSFAASPTGNRDAPNSPLHLLAFGSTEISYVMSLYRGERFSWLRMSGTNKSRQVRTSAAAAGIRSLIDRTVVEQLPDGEKQVWSHTPNSATVLAEVGAEGAAEPVALLMHRHDHTSNGALRLLLPSQTTDHAQWLAFYLRFLHDANPEQFPSGPQWQSDAQWAPLVLERLLHERDELAADRAQVLADLDARAAALSVAIEREQRSAASGVHRILTGQGDDLVEAVCQCLVEIGFTVRDMDRERADGEPKLEDLRVTDDSDPNWVALVEVKGYTKGAKASDVSQLVGRPVAAFVKETGDRPGSLWHIVNAHRETNPASREVALAGDPSTLEILATNDGALLDTRDLFLAWKSVKNGERGADDLRAELRAARRRWSL